MACTTANEGAEATPNGVNPNEIVCDLVTQMYPFKPKSDRAYCTTADKELVKKYHFMKDSGTSVSGFESFHCITRHNLRVLFFSTLQGSWEFIERVHNVRSSSGPKRSPLNEDHPTLFQEFCAWSTRERQQTGNSFCSLQSVAQSHFANIVLYCFYC